MGFSFYRRVRFGSKSRRSGSTKRAGRTRHFGPITVTSRGAISLRLGDARRRKKFF